MPLVERVAFPGTVSLRAALLAHTAVRCSAAAEAPRIRWPLGGSRWPRPVTVGLLVLLVSVAAVTVEPWPLLLVGPLIGIRWWQRSSTRPLLPPVVIADHGQLMPSQVARLIPSDEHPVGPSPAERVEIVKAAYGRLLADIVYRIENSALFDASVSETNRFQVALASWNAGASDTGRLAEEIEASFDAARREAERIGVAHLPSTARAQAQRAVKAVRVALSTAPDAEREAALSRADEILRSLALHYLPTVDRRSPSLIGSRRAIEPAP